MDGRTRRILFVEDDPIERMALSRLVRTAELPLDVTSAGSRRDAESLLENGRFDGAILDFHLGDGTALDLLPRLVGTPVIVTSGAGSEEKAVASLKSGAVDYVVKDAEGKYLEGLPRALEAAAEEERRRMERRLLRECQKFAIDEHSLVSVTDLSGKILYANERFCATSQYSREELVGRDHRIVNSGYHPKTFFAWMWDTLRKGEVWRGEIRNRAKDGSCYWVKTTIVPFRGPSGAVTHYVSVRTDVTEQKHLALQLRLAKDAAESASQTKTEFLARMSHEIRTPMNGIMGTAELLRQTGLDADQEDILGVLATSADTLLRLIDDILDMSRIEAGKMVVDAVPFSPLACILEVSRVLEAQARGKSLDLNVSVAPGLPGALMGDPVRLKQVLYNLAGNAIKFTETGHVTLEMDCRRTGQGTAVLAVAVEDSGIGIPEDKLGIIFESFSQADTSPVRRRDGSGLGLAIARKLVGLMGGRLEVESRQGSGSVFRFAIECRTAPGEDAPPPADVRLAGKRVLRLDGESRRSRALGGRLEEAGMRQEPAGTMAQATAMLHAAKACGDPYHFAVLPRPLPMREVEAWAQELLALGHLRETRLIVQACFESRRELDRLEKAGIAACLSGVFATSEVLAALSAAESPPGERAFAGSARAPSSRPDGTSLGAAGEREPEMKLAAPCRVLLAEDNVVNAKLAARMLQGFGCAVDIATNGKDALESALSTPYDLILMDCHMPEMDGWETTRKIRSSGSSSMRTPIVALTADAMVGDRDRCMEAGMDDYVTKPMKVRTLWEAVHRNLRGRPRQPRA